MCNIVYVAPEIMSKCKSPRVAPIHTQEKLLKIDHTVTEHEFKIAYRILLA